MFPLYDQGCLHYVPENAVLDQIDWLNLATGFLCATSFVLSITVFESGHYRQAMRHCFLLLITQIIGLMTKDCELCTKDWPYMCRSAACKRQFQD